jgi:Fur family ferric uptake transcriptional regulator
MSCSTVLKEKGFKLTPQRRLILEYIRDNESHFTAEEILDFVGLQAPGINKSTVYRTLELLEETGCVYKSELGDHCIYHHADKGHHHHLVCSKCGKTIECGEDLFASVERSLVEKYGFHVDFKHVVMSGLCRECRRKTT